MSAPNKRRLTPRESAALFITSHGQNPDESTTGRVSDSRLRRLFDANVVGIVIANNAGAILEANDTFLDLIGYSRTDLEEGRVDWRRLTPQEWLHLDERAIEEMAMFGTISQYEKEYVRKDGSRVPVSLGGARIEGTADEQICYIVDLTQIRRAEAALRRSESRFKRLSDADVIGLITLRISDDTLVSANDEFLRTIGYAREEFAAGKVDWRELTPPQWREASERAVNDLRACGRFTPYEKEYLRKDGTPVPVLIGGALLEGSDDETICYVLDLTKQAHALRQIQTSERRYRALIEAIPQMIILADESRQPNYVNRHYEEYTGVGSADVAARWREAIHPDDLPAVDAARSSGEAFEVEYRIRRASDGAYRWHFARSLPLPEDSSPDRWLAAAIDIDDRKRAEESLRFIERAASRLSQSLDLQTTFDTLLDLVVPAFGDWASINLRGEDGIITTVVARHKDPAMAQRARDLCGVAYFKDSHAWGTGAVYVTGVPQLRSNISAEQLAAAVKSTYIDVFDDLGYGSLIALPIFSGDEVIGSFGIVSVGDRRTYTTADLPPLQELARRAGFAIANARRFEREHRVADLLQDAALPRKLPRVAGLRFDAFYQAGRREASIGGDWFDALIVADGRIVISVGDVAGSGLDAAVLMGSMRQVIRGAAHVYADPMLMLDVADRSLRSEHEQSMVTAFVGVIDPARRTMVYASAGHLPALLRAHDGQLTQLDAPGLPIGWRDMAPSESRTTILPRGSCLLLYTDGLVEWSRDILSGEAQLRERFAALDSDEVHPAKALVESILPPSGARDDVAVLTVTVDS